VRAALIVVDPPSFDLLFGFVNRLEPMHILWRDDLGERCATIKMEIGLRSVGIMPVLIVADKCYASA
jgi:hypothetical protein